MIDGHTGHLRSRCCENPPPLISVWIHYGATTHGELCRWTRIGNRFSLGNWANATQVLKLSIQGFTYCNVASFESFHQFALCYDADCWRSLAFHLNGAQLGVEKCRLKFGEMVVLAVQHAFDSGHAQSLYL
jgi:hypothetical protein